MATQTASVELLSTTDYDQFQFDEKNRPLNSAHVKALKESIDERNLLHVAPGVIGRDMIVIDGQHRLRAASELEVPFYYILDESLSIDDAPVLNQEQMNWDLEQWESYWIKSGETDYQTLKDFRKKHGLSISVSVSLVFNKNAHASGKINDIYRSGEFEFRHEDFARAIAEMLDEIEDLPGAKTTIDFAKNQSFILALLTAVKSGEYDHDHFMDQLRAAPYRLEKQADRKNYLRNIEDVYNYKQPNKVRFF